MITITSDGNYYQVTAEFDNLLLSFKHKDIYELIIIIVKDLIESKKDLTSFNEDFQATLSNNNETMYNILKLVEKQKEKIEMLELERGFDIRIETLAAFNMELLERLAHTPTRKEEEEIDALKEQLEMSTLKNQALTKVVHGNNLDIKNMSDKIESLSEENKCLKNCCNKKQSEIDRLEKIVEELKKYELFELVRTMKNVEENN